MQLDMLELPGFWQGNGFGHQTYLVDEVFLGPDPFGVIDERYWTRFDHWSAPAEVIQKTVDGQKRFPGGWYTNTQSRLPRHPLVVQYKPGWLIENGKAARRLSSQSPIIHLREKGRLVGVLGFYAGISFRDLIVPIDSELQSDILKEETRLALLSLLEDLSQSLPSQLIPVSVVRIDAGSWQLTKTRVWLEVPIPARLIVPMTISQRNLTEWLSEQITARQSRTIKGSSIWTTRRIAQRIGVWTNGLRVIKWKDRLPRRLNAVVDFFQCFRPSLALDHFPRFLPDNEGTHAFCANIKEMSEADRLRWRSILGQFDKIAVNSQDRRSLSGRLLKSRPGEVRYSITSYPQCRLELARKVEEFERNGGGRK